MKNSLHGKAVVIHSFECFELYVGEAKENDLRKPDFSGLKGTFYINIKNIKIYIITIIYYIYV